MRRYHNIVMDPRSHDIECPCCKAKISVDAETGAILTFKASRKVHLSFDEAADVVRTEKERVESKFSKAMEERSRRADLLEKKFRKAAEKAADDPEKPPNPLDFD